MNFMFLICVLIAYVIVNFTKMTSGKKKINSEWEQVDAQLKRKFDLTQNLVEIFYECFAQDKTNILEDVIAAQNNFFRAQNPQQLIDVNLQMDKALKKLFVETENYTSLKESSELKSLKKKFEKIQAQISEYIADFQNNMTESAWRQIENKIRQKFSLIPNLNATVEKYISSEKIILDNINQIRDDYFHAQTPEEKMQITKQMSIELKRLFNSAKNYPKLQANFAFTNFEQKISKIEDKIGYLSQNYNEAVKKYNESTLIYPNNFLSKPFGFRKIKYFNTDELQRSTNLKVEF